MTDPTPQTTSTRDEAVPTDERRIDLPNGYYLFQMRPSDMTCSLHMPDGLHIGNLLAQHAGADFASAMLASAPTPASGGVDAVADLQFLLDYARGEKINKAHIVRAIAVRLQAAKALAKPAGGDVAEAAELLERAKAWPGAWVSGGASTALDQAYWINDVRKFLASLSQSTSAGRVGE